MGDIEKENRWVTAESGQHREDKQVGQRVTVSDMAERVDHR